MKKDLKKLLILNLPFLFIWYFADKISWLYRMVDAKNAGMKIYGCMMYFKSAFKLWIKDKLMEGIWSVRI